MDWKKHFKERKELVLATCSDNRPHANIVISLGFIDDKLLVADCQMKTTSLNLAKNPFICVVSGHYRLKGEVKLYSSGKYYDLAAKKSEGYAVKQAILITPSEAFDLDKGKKIY